MHPSRTCVLAALTAAALVFAPAPTARADEDASEACTRGQAAPAQVESQCSVALESGALPAQRRAALLIQRGLARMRGGRLDAAGQDFGAAVELDGGNAWGHNARAVYWMQRGRPDQAIADYEQAVKLAPGYAFAWANLGSARLVNGQVDQAIADLGESLRLAPQRAEIALTGRGRAWLAKGDCARALDDFSAALQANPRHANAFSGRAYARFCLGEFDAAAADFRNERQIRQDAESAVDLVIALRRGGHDAHAELAELAGTAEAARGLSPGLALFNGSLTPEQRIEASADRDPHAAQVRLCAGSFEVAEWYLVNDDRKRARQYLEQSRAQCDPSQREYGAAGAELARLK